MAFACLSSTPQSVDELPREGAFWCCAITAQKPALKGEVAMSDSELTEGLHRGCSFFRQPLSRLAATAPRPGSLLVQCKHIVQCRTPRGAIVSIPITPPSYTPARASVRFWLLRHQHRLKARAQDSARQAPSCIHAHRPFSARFWLSSHLC